ncbi:MAG: AmmeMemoRadiSam system protein B, partial [bacterium]
AVAGRFYPAAPAELRRSVRALLAEAEPPPDASTRGWPKAIVAPHAGYVYSGPVAASAYRWLEPDRSAIRRIVLVGPAHHAAVLGLALPRADAFETPLGLVPVDEEAARALATLPQVGISEAAHAREHSLEVHLPFLQEILPDFAIVPLLVGSAETHEVAEVLEHAWGGPETRIIVSSDLSHDLDYETARRLDAATCAAIEALRLEELDPERACGAEAIRGLLSVARRKGIAPRTVDLRSSGDTAGPRDQVVGYGAWVLD